MRLGTPSGSETSPSMDQHDCPFCRLDTDRIRAESAFAVA